MKNNKNGFTLIELIVSVTIIAVMTVVAVVSYTGASKKARDNRRMADLEKVRIALELYRQATGNPYPATGNLSAISPTYIQQLPVDPKTGSNYYYVRSNSYTYLICANVENSGSVSSDVSSCSGLPAGYAGYYKITNP